jgi:hypothetical protein
MLDVAPLTKAEAPAVTSTAPVPLDTAAADRFFASVGRTGHPLWLAYYSLRPRHSTANANWDAFSGDM